MQPIDSIIDAVKAQARAVKDKKKLALRSGMSYSLLLDFLNGAHMINTVRFLSLCQALDIDWAAIGARAVRFRPPSSPAPPPAQTDDEVEVLGMLRQRQFRELILWAAHRVRNPAQPRAPRALPVPAPDSDFHGPAWTGRHFHDGESEDEP